MHITHVLAFTAQSTIMSLITILRLDPLHGATLAGLGAGAVLGGAIKGVEVISRKRRRGLYLRKRPTPHCARCAGFGIVRCELCHGNGVCETPLTGDMIPCPRCTMQRHVKCELCNGAGARSPAFNMQRWKPTGRTVAKLRAAATNATLAVLAFLTARSLLRTKTRQQH